MLIKVCGLKDPENISEVIKLNPDMMGFIFYKHSPRYVGELDAEIIQKIPQNIERVGVFVNESCEKMLEIAQQYHLTTVQLHGHETPEVCEQMRRHKLKVIKAFGIHDKEDLLGCQAFQRVCDYFLFDTKSKKYGGTGNSFRWELLREYSIPLPFLLSGGISPDCSERLRLFSHPQFWGIDLNSRFEVVPGVKDIQVLSEFFSAIRFDV